VTSGIEKKMRNLDMERLLIPAEVASALRVKLDTLRIWRNRGCGPVYVHVGRLCRYRESDVAVFIDRCEGEGRDDEKPTGTLG